MATAQDAINKLRLQIGETDANNSRWTDLQLLIYLNDGRREFAKQSEALKSEFQQTTVAGPTLGNTRARYTLDPSVWNIDVVIWDDFEVESINHSEFDEFMSLKGPGEVGRPFIYTRIGDSIDLYFAPHEARLLQIYASIFTTPMTALTDNETELNTDQIQAAVDYATFAAFTDDDRDGTSYAQKFGASVRQWKKKVHKTGAHFVNVHRDVWRV